MRRLGSLWAALGIVLALSAPAAGQSKPRLVQSLTLAPATVTPCQAGTGCIWRTSSALHYHGPDNSDTVLGSGGGGGGSSLTASLSDGVYTHTLTVGNPSSGVLLQIAPGDPSPYTPFNFTYQSNHDNGNGQPNDNVFNYGHNLNGGTGQIDPTKGAIGGSIESWFIAGHPQQEMHAIGFPPNTVPLLQQRQTRFYSYEVHDDDGSTAAYYFSTNITLGSGFDANDPPSILVAPTTTTIQSPPTTLSPGLTPLAYAFGTFDVGTLTLGANNSSHVTKAQLILDSTGSGQLTTSSIGRLTDSRNSGNPSFQWDNGSSQVLSPDNTTQLSVGNGQAALFVNSALLLAAQPTQVFIPDKLLYVKRDGGGTNTRGDTIASLLVRNNTAATGGATQQFSPSVVLTGYGWTGSANRAVSFQLQSQPDGTGAGSLAFAYSNDEANYSTVLSLSSAGGVGFFGHTAPTAQYNTTGTTTGFTAGVGTAAKSDSTYTGNTGSTAYTTGDIVRALKLSGYIAP